MSMDRNEVFEAEGISGLRVKMTFGSLEIISDETDQLQLMISGDAKDVEDVRVQEHDGVLTVDQPVYGRVVSLSFGSEKWLQVFLRVPKSWRGSLEASTMGGSLSVRGITGTDLSLDTMSGQLRASAISAIKLGLRTVTGMAALADSSGDMLTLRTGTGCMVTDGVAFRAIRVTAVSADLALNVREPFESLEGSVAAGALCVSAPMDRMDATLRTATGRLLTNGVSIAEGAPKVGITTVSGDVELIRTEA